MPTLTNSAFLQSLGYAITHSLWQFAIVWALSTALNNFIAFSAKIKYAIAVFAQFVGFVWFVFTFQYYYFQCTQAIEETGILTTAKGITFILPYNESTFKSYLLSFFLRTEQILPYLSVAYILVLLTLSIKWINSYQSAQNLRTKGLQKIDVNWRIFVKQTASYLGLKKEVNIYLSKYVSTPLTIGFLKPIILIPLASINHLNTEQMEAVLLHELAHIKRMDYLLNISLSAIETILFFNPFTQLISTSIKQEREHSCDDWVLQFQYNANTYAQALLQIAVLQNVPTIAMAAVKSKNDLLSRVRRMVDKKSNNYNYRNQLITLLLITLVLVGITLIVPQDKNSNKNFTKEKGSIKNKQVMLEPMTAKVSNPLFNPFFFFRKPLQDEIKRGLEQAEIEIAASAKELQTTNREVAAVMPFALHALEALQQNMQLSNAENDVIEKRITKNIGCDTVKKVTEPNGLYEKAFADNWLQFGAEIKKLGTNLEKAKKDIEKASKKNVTVEAEMNRAFAQLKNMQIPFTLKGTKLEDSFKESLKKLAFDKLTEIIIKAQQTAEKEKQRAKKDSMLLVEIEKGNIVATNYSIEEPITTNYSNIPESVMQFTNAVNRKNSEPPIINTSYINNQEISHITINRNKQLAGSTENSIKPKIYEVVVSNKGKADKKIIIEVY